MIVPGGEAQMRKLILLLLALAIAMAQAIILIVLTRKLSG